MKKNGRFTWTRALLLPRCELAATLRFKSKGNLVCLNIGQLNMDAAVLPAYVDVSHPILQGAFRMPFDSDDNIESAMKYEANAGDLFICSYPKCGCTWLQSMIWRILHNGEGMKGHIRDNIPFLDFDGSESIMKVQPSDGYKVIKTHFPYVWVPKHPLAKYVFIAREPKDVCVSLYYHVKGFEGYNWSDGRFDDFVDLFLDGKADAGDYFEMLDDWLQLESTDSIHIMLYEEVILDQREEIRKLAKFMGSELEAKLIAESGSILESIMENTTFRKMHEQEKNWVSIKQAMKSFCIEIWPRSYSQNQ